MGVGGGGGEGVWVYGCLCVRVCVWLCGLFPKPTGHANAGYAVMLAQNMLQIGQNHVYIYSVHTVFLAGIPSSKRSNKTRDSSRQSYIC